MAGGSEATGGLDLGAIKEATAKLKETAQQLKTERELRAANLNPQRPSEDDLKRLDSSVKRNSALVKKLRQLTEEGCAGVLKDVANTNQSKYVSEVVAAVAESPRNVKDTPAIVQVCSLLHQRYAEFATQIGPALVKVFSTKAATPDDERALLKRKRATLKLLAELMTAAVLPPGPQPLLGVVQDLAAAAANVRKDREGAQAALSLLAALAKSAREPLLGAAAPLPELPLPPELLGSFHRSGGDGGGVGAAADNAQAAPAPAEASAAEAEGEAQKQADGGAAAGTGKDAAAAAAEAAEAAVAALPPAVAAAVRALQAAYAEVRAGLAAQYRAPQEEQVLLGKALSRAFQAGAAALSDEHRALGEAEQENVRVVNSRGDLPPEMAAEYERRRKSYEALHRAVGALAEALDRPMPELMEDAFTRLGATESGAAAAAAAGAAGAAGGAGVGGSVEHVFEDLESRMFYESLPDIKSMVPAVLLGLGTETAPAAAAQGTGGGEDGVKDGAAAEAADGGAAGSADSSAAAGADPAVAAAAAAVPEPDLGAAAEGGAATAQPPPTDDSGGGGGGPAPSQLESILSQLPHCVSRDTADELSVNFCFINSKAARKRLVRALCDVPKACLQLVPFYARVVATLAQVFPDVHQGVVSYLESEFQTLIAKKDATTLTLEPRVRNARYLAELTKFRLVAPGTFFVALKQLLDDFTHHNVDAACAMVETAGRMLIRMPETKIRMENMLEVMGRLKNVKNLDSRRCAQVDWAYASVKQHGRQVPRKQRAPMQEYIRHLLLVRLSKSSVGEVAKKLLKVPWEENERYILKCLLKAVRGRFTNIPLVSALVGGLAQVHDSLGIAFVDQVLEDVRWGLENPSLGTYQKRLADVRLLGELYNYSLFNSVPVFETLYLIITFGHESPELAARIDPFDEYYRVRMVCTLLDTCGTYFSEGRAAAKLDRFLMFFQAYLLSKQQPIPLDVEFDVQDVLHHLRPRLVRYGSYEEALAAVTELLSAEAAAGAAAGVLGAIDEDDDDDDERRGGPRSEASDASEAEGATGAVGGSSSDEREPGVELDPDFEKEYQQIMFESQGKVVPAKAPVQLSLAPAFGAGSAGPGGAAAGAGAGAGGPEAGHKGQGQYHQHLLVEEGGAGGEDNMAFKLLMKRGGKDDRSREILVPSSAPIAVNVRVRADAEAREREEVKRLTLMANRVQEQEQAAIHRAHFGRPAGGHAGYAGRGGGASTVGGQGAGPGGQGQRPAGGQRGGGAGGGGGGRRGPSVHQFGNVDALGLDYQTVPKGPRPPKQ